MSIKNWTGPSKSESYFANKSNIPLVSQTMVKEISPFRRIELEKEVENGLFRDGSSNRSSGLTKNSIGVNLSSGINKYSQALSTGSSGDFRGGNGNTVRQIPEVYSPLWLNSNLNLPRDRATINAWCRSFFALNPFVNNAISLHSTYPISKLNIKCPNKEVEKFFNDMIEEIDLMNICVQIAQEYWLLGEAFVYAELDENKGKWARLLIQNPDYMTVKRTVVADEPVIMLRPDENLKNLIFSNRPTDIEQRKQLPQYVIESVKRGNSIPLDNFSVSHLARKISPYEIRGTGLPVSIFRQLMLFDSLRESKFAQASSMINPLTLIKVGSEGPDGLHPTVADLESWRNIFEAAEADKNFKIITHPGVSVERVGFGQGIYDISGDITQLVKEIFIGLWVPSIIMDGGGDVTYGNAGITIDVLKQRYMQFRNMISAWLRRKIFAPIAKLQGFYEYSGGTKTLVIPEIDWNHMALFDAGDYIQNLVTLTQPDGDGTRRVSLHSLYRSIGLEYEDEVRKIRRESIQNAISAKEKEALLAMSLNEIRALDEDNEIPEPKTPAEGNIPVPGESPGMSGLPGVDTGAPPPDMGPPPSGPPTPPPAGPGQ